MLPKHDYEARPWDKCHTLPYVCIVFEKVVRYEHLWTNYSHKTLWMIDQLRVFFSLYECRLVCFTCCTLPSLHPLMHQIVSFMLQVKLFAFFVF